MSKETVYLRGHHLRLLHDYAYFAVYHKDNPELRNYRTELKDKRVIKTAIEDGHSKKHGINITHVLKKALKPGIKIRLTDTLDDICKTCNYKTKRFCKEFIPYDFSTTCEDRAVLRHYSFKRREYTSGFLIKRLLEKGRDP